MKSVRVLARAFGKVRVPSLFVVAIATLVAPTIHNRGRVEAAGGCKDIPLRVTLFNSAVDTETGNAIATAIQSDGGEYVNGVNSSVVIKVCTGTNDAVVNVSATKRTFVFNFPSPLEGSVFQGQPSWVSRPQQVSGWISVRNITYRKTPFTTRAGATFTLAADRNTYRLGFLPVDADAPDLTTGSIDPAIDNTPFPTSPATVYPTYPEVCGPGSMPTWLVRGTATNSVGQLQVAALHKIPNRGPQIHQGQYSMPFEMRIEALQCFQY
jgi:hypothetical protein